MGKDPVPVQKGHVLFAPGKGMPAQEVVVVRTDLASSIMVTEVVIIGLGKGDTQEAKDQHRDPRNLRSRSLQRPLEGHVQASCV